jgi:hypothetical protein
VFTTACIAGIKASESVLMLDTPRAADQSSDTPKLLSVLHNSDGRPKTTDRRGGGRMQFSIERLRMKMSDARGAGEGSTR